jgi:hypothetical protein
MNPETTTAGYSRVTAPDPLVSTLSYIASMIGRYTEINSTDCFFEWRIGGNLTLWIELDGTVNVDMNAVDKCVASDLLDHDEYYIIVGYCVTHRIPCVLNFGNHAGRTSRKAWRH